MRIASVVEPGLFASAERCAMRLDGDCFDLGLSAAAIDALVGPEARAASLRAAVDRHGLVIDTRTAAWVHGSSPVLPAPLTLAIDLDRGRATRAMLPSPREARFGPGEVVVLGGARVTSPLKTAFDLLLREGRIAEGIALDLLRRTGLDPEEVALRIGAMPKHNGKHRIAARARELLRRKGDPLEPPRARPTRASSDSPGGPERPGRRDTPAFDGSGEDQPADTR